MMLGIRDIFSLSYYTVNISKHNIPSHSSPLNASQCSTLYDNHQIAGSCFLSISDHMSQCDKSAVMSVSQ